MASMIGNTEDQSDWAREGGQFVRRTGPRKVRDHVDNRIRVPRGSVYFDLTAGIPYYGEVLGKVPLPAYESLIRGQISGTPELANVNLSAEKSRIDVRTVIATWSGVVNSQPTGGTVDVT